MNDPAVLERRRQRVAALDAQVAASRARRPGRVPDWPPERLARLDRLALEAGKRCVMWDDAGAGFYLMLNWDWLRNRPAEAATPAEAHGPGWWAAARELLRPPLLDPAVPAAELAAWLDEHTMRPHAVLEKRLATARAAPELGPRAVAIDGDEYYATLRELSDALPPPAEPRK
jgi:hypothetical protein